MSSCCDFGRRCSALPQLAAEMCDALVPGATGFAMLVAHANSVNIFASVRVNDWLQGGASFASFTCGAAFEGLQCDFLLLAYWTHLFALKDEERYNGRHFLRIFSHVVYHVLQTILTTLWLGTR